MRRRHPARRSLALALVMAAPLWVAAWDPGASAVASGTPAMAEPSPLAHDVEAWLAPLVRSGQLSGTLLVARHGRVEFEHSYGHVDRGGRVPLTPETRLNIASITKPITLAIAVQLLGEHKLGLTDSLTRWLPEFPRGDEITVEHLLRHRAGIPHRVTEAAEERRPTHAADMVQYAARRELLFVPGEKSIYSSAGYSVLARVLELASGQRYGDLARERVFEPLGMTRTIDADERYPVARRPTSFVPMEAGFTEAPFQDLSFLVGAGSVYSTPRDLLRLLEGVTSGALGSGVRASLVRRGAVHWNGSTNGFRAFVDWDSTTGVAVIFAGNRHIGVNDLIQQAIPRIAAGEAVSAPAVRDPAMARLPEARLRGYEGVYLLANGTRLEVTARHGRLWANEWMLVPTADSVFFSPRDYGEIRVVAGEQGEVARLDWSVGGGVMAAERIGDLHANDRK